MTLDYNTDHIVGTVMGIDPWTFRQDVEVRVRVNREQEIRLDHPDRIPPLFSHAGARTLSAFLAQAADLAEALIAQRDRDYEIDAAWMSAMEQ